MKRAISYVCLIAVAAALSGCPSSPFRLGVWIFYLSNPALNLARDIETGGDTSPPDPLPAGADNTFAGTMRWQRNDTTVTINQTDGDNMYQYVGELSSPTQMAGTYQQTAGTGNLSGTFTAAWVNF